MAEQHETSMEMDQDLEVLMLLATRLEERNPFSSYPPPLRRVVRRVQEGEAELARLRNTLAGDDTQGEGDEKSCPECGRPVVYGGSGRKPEYDSDECRKKAHRRRERQRRDETTEMPVSGP